MTVAFWAVTVIWLLATVAANAPGTGDRIRRLDALGVVPAWTFFAPNPGVSDQMILVRDQLEDGSWSAWRVAWRDRPTRLRMWWRPAKRESKLITDCASTLPRLHLAGDASLSASFLLIGTIAHKAEHDFRAVGFQFAITNVTDWWSGNPQQTLAYRSPLIGLPQRQGAPG